MARAAVVVVTVVVVLVGLLWAMQRQLIYLPATGHLPAAGTAIPGATDVTLRTSDGLDLGAWLVPAQPPDRHVTVLLAHGNAGDRSARAPLARALAARGLSVLLFDYRGYGGNPGSPSESGLARDVRAGWRFLEQRGDDPVVYFGESLGAAVVTELATEHPPAALVLRSPFTSLDAVARHHYPYLPVKLLLRDRYPVAEQIARVPVPTLVVYGSADGVVPASQSRRVAEVAAGETRVVEIPGADHNDPALVDGPSLIDAVDALVSRIAR